MEELKEGMKVLYVCPWAHRAGHYPEAVIRETSALSEAGIEVYLCTFEGILDQKGPPRIPQRTVLSSWISFPLGIFAHSLNFSPRVRIIAQLLEAIATLFLAVKLRSSFRYDVIYLRDGDPFIFLPFLFGLVLKNYRWAILLTGHLGEMARIKWFPYRFSVALFWKPIYHRSLSKNKYAFICQNKYVRDFFEREFLGGILSGRVTVVPRGAVKTGKYIPQKEARKRLSLPDEKVIFLHFGALHLGKDIETILVALEDIPNVLLVHAGEITAGVDLIGMVNHYGLQDRVLIKDQYIREAEKQYYFASADAIILSYKRDFIQLTSVLWEAAAFKLPAIVSDSGELGTLVKRYKTGLVFKAEDATSLKDALSHFFICSRSQKEAMKRNWDKFYDDFSLDGWAQKCIEVLSSESYLHQ